VKLALLALAACIQPLAAQDPPSPIIYIYREQIKSGKSAAYTQIEEAAARFCAKANCPNPYLAITSLTGPNEAWWINGFDSMDAMEKVWHQYGANQEISQELDRVAEKKADLAFSANIWMARFRDDLSFSSTQLSPHFISISVIHVRPGHVANFEKMRQFLRNVQRNSIGHPLWVYQVTSGAEDTTFLVMIPGRTMQEIQATPVPDDHLSNLGDLIRDAIASSETRLYAVSPSMSMPASSWVEADPDFWKRP
jgi:hypothetical protein